MIEKKCVMLLSGGFDSAVSAYILKKQGYDITSLHMSFNRYTGNSSIQKCKKISEIIGIPTANIIDISDVAELFVEKCKHPYYFLLLKRFFIRFACIIADSLPSPASFIATGDNLGQVGSQTLSNLRSIQTITSKRILTPLIAMDKVEILQLSKKIGVYSVASGEEVCDILGPPHPITQSTPERIEHEESKLGDYHSLLENAYSKTNDTVGAEDRT